MKHIKGIIFDLDDTLAPESAFAYSAFRAAARFLSAETSRESDMLYRRMVDIFKYGDRRHIFNTIVSEFGLSDRFPDIGVLVNLYREHRPDSEYCLYPDVPEYLPRFVKRFKCALLTDGFFPSQENKIEALGLDKFFSPVIINHSHDEFKPSPRSYHAILEQWKLEAGETAAAGDNPAKDFITPNSMGMLTFRIKRNGIHRHLRGSREGRAVVTARNLAEMWDMVTANRGLFPLEPNITGKNCIGKDLLNG